MRIRINNGLLAKDLASTGLGAALVIDAAIQADLKAGRLVRLLPGYRFGVVVLRLLMRDTHPSPAALAFAEFIQTPPSAPVVPERAARGARPRAARRISGTAPSPNR